MPEFVWTVAEHSDRITKRNSKKVSEDIADNNRRWGGKIKLHAAVFDTSSDAEQFVMNRAQTGVHIAEEKLREAHARMNRLKKKFGSQTDYSYRKNHALVCALCGKAEGYHKARTLHCPTGPKTRIGYCAYDPVNTFTPKSRKRS